MQPLVIAHHLIWTVYGWWLPNDPRGSGSQTIVSDVIAQLGVLHHGRRSLQPAGHEVRAFYERAANVLRHELRKLDRPAIQVVGKALAAVIARERYTCWACAIMPDHVHLLIRKHKHQAEDMIEHLKRESRLRLSSAGLFDADHPIWTDGGGWKVFLDHPDDVRRTIAYIERNPQEIAAPPQRWPFISPYDNWPLHAGHSPQSPYAKALCAAGRYPCATHPKPRAAGESLRGGGCRG